VVAAAAAAAARRVTFARQSIPTAAAAGPGRVDDGRGGWARTPDDAPPIRGRARVS